VIIIEFCADLFVTRSGQDGFCRIIRGGAKTDRINHRPSHRWTLRLDPCNGKTIVDQCHLQFSVFTRNGLGGCGI
jgi:hypothetical protein